MTAPQSMTKKPKTGLVPSLRFPEFRETGPWMDVPIDRILDVREEKRVPTADTPLYSLTIEDGVTAKSARYNREFLVRDSENKKYKLVDPNDIVYNPSNLRWGAINYSRLKHSVVISPIYEVLYLKDFAANHLEFIATSVMRDAQIARFVTKGQGTLVERIAVKIDDFLATDVSVPATFGEQHRIASCLSSLDDLIAAERQKLDTLKAHKQGLMQHLFPREGETRPRLRFPEFRDWPGWASVPLKQFADINPSTDELPDSFIYIDLESVEAGELKTRNRISRQGAPSRAQRLLRNGDVIFQTVRPYQKNNLFCVCEEPENYVASTGYAQLRARQSDKFLYHAVHNDAFVSAVMAKCTGSNYPAINSADLAEIGIAVPSSLPEQHRIASCLSSLDNLIAAQSNKLEALKAHKKGLMQQLFPSPEENTP